MAAALQCEICGGKLVGRPGGVFECDSYGMEYSTEWAKAKIQEIRGTVQIEGTVEVTGKVQVEGGTVQVEGTANKESLIKRGFMACEDGKWDEAKGFFDRALDADAECAEAYVGLLMADKKVRERSALGLLDDPFDDSEYYKKAVCFADGKLQTALEELLSSSRALQGKKQKCLLEIKKREEERERKQAEEDELLSRRAQEMRRRVCAARGLISAAQFHIAVVRSDGTVSVYDAKGARVSGEYDALSGVAEVAIADDYPGFYLACRLENGTVRAFSSGKPGKWEVGSWRGIDSVKFYNDALFGIRKDGTVALTYFASEEDPNPEHSAQIELGLRKRRSMRSAVKNQVEKLNGVVAITCVNQKVCFLTKYGKIIDTKGNIEREMERYSDDSRGILSAGCVKQRRTGICGWLEFRRRNCNGELEGHRIHRRKRQ